MATPHGAYRRIDERNALCTGLLVVEWSSVASVVEARKDRGFDPRQRHLGEYPNGKEAVCKTVGIVPVEVRLLSHPSSLRRIRHVSSPLESSSDALAT